MLLNSGVIDSQLINTSYVVEYVGNTLKSKNDVTMRSPDIIAYNDILVPAATGDWELIGYTVDWAENI
jgi:hypothetical protein